MITEYEQGKADALTAIMREIPNLMVQNEEGELFVNVRDITELMFRIILS